VMVSTRGGSASGSAGKDAPRGQRGDYTQRAANGEEAGSGSTGCAVATTLG
jgi:hypothetical protein